MVLCPWWPSACFAPDHETLKTLYKSTACADLVLWPCRNRAGGRVPDGGVSVTVYNHDLNSGFWPCKADAPYLPGGVRTKTVKFLASPDPIFGGCVYSPVNLSLQLADDGLSTCYNWCIAIDFCYRMGSNKANIPDSGLGMLF